MEPRALGFPVARSQKWVYSSVLLQTNKGFGCGMPSSARMTAKKGQEIAV